MKSNAEKQRDFKARRAELGFVRREYWLTLAEHKQIRELIERMRDATRDKNSAA